MVSLDRLGGYRSGYEGVPHRVGSPGSPPLAEGAWPAAANVYAGGGVHAGVGEQGHRAANLLHRASLLAGAAQRMEQENELAAAEAQVTAREDLLASREVLKKECSALCNGWTCLAAITGLALFIIACVAAGGKFPTASTLGPLVISFAGAGLISTLIAQRDRIKEKKMLIAFTVAVQALIISLAVLGMTGVLNPQQVGYGILGTSLGSQLVIFPLADFTTKQLLKKEKERLGLGAEQV